MNTNNQSKLRDVADKTEVSNLRKATAFWDIVTDVIEERSLMDDDEIEATLSVIGGQVDKAMNEMFDRTTPQNRLAWKIFKLCENAMKAIATKDEDTVKLCVQKKAIIDDMLAQLDAKQKEQRQKREDAAQPSKTTTVQLDRSNVTSSTNT